MKTIITEKNELTIINKSKFICYLFKINNIDQIEDYLNEIKEKYKDATHHCYAYIIGNQKKCSDDKEPSGTAGMPILNVLEKNDLNNVLCIVVRYFGGIKLGAGGLVRAYTNSVTNCLKDNIKELIKGLKIEITFNYDKVKQIDNFLKDTIIKKEFNETIKYEFQISKNEYNNIYETLNNLCLDINIIDDDIAI